MLGSMGMMSAMDSDVISQSIRSQADLKRFIMKAIFNDNAQRIRNLPNYNFSALHMNERDRFSLYKDLLWEAIVTGKMNSFTALIDRDPFNCLNIPMQWPNETSDFRTIYDALTSGYFPGSPYTPYYEAAALHGAKTLQQLLNEGYVLPPKLEPTSEKRTGHRYGREIID